MDPYASLLRNGRPFNWGRPAADKPSFDGLPSSVYGSLPNAVLVAEEADLEWERVETLFESGWHGPCGCMGSDTEPAFSRNNSASSSGRVAAEQAAGPSRPPTTAPRDPNSPRASCSLFSILNSWSRPDPARSHNTPLLNGQGKGGGPPVLEYEPGAAPLPEPPFSSTPPGTLGSSPLKAVPVPRRLPGEADGNALQVGLPIDPVEAGLLPPDPVPAPAPASPFSSYETGRTVPVELAPQLGTWADRQYRLLDPVPERGEGGPGSCASGRVSSSSGGLHSPVNRGGYAGPKAAAAAANGDCSGSGDCSGGASGSAGGSSSAVAQVSGNGHLSGFSELPSSISHASHNGHQPDPLETGRRRPGGEANLLSAFQLMQQQQQDEEERRRREAEAAAAAAAAAADPEAHLAEAAWRWRFTRRWQAEQSRTDVERTASASTDQMEEALAYLHATGATTTTTVSMQIANTSGGGRRGGRASGRTGGAAAAAAGSLVGGAGTMSLESSLMTGGVLASSTLGGTDGLLAASGSGSFTRPRLLDGQSSSGDLAAASREVVSLHRRAAAVLQQQLDCERQAEQRVQESLAVGPPWVGQFLPVVQIDEWGSFRFVMLKLRDQTARLSGPGGGLGGGLGGERQRILIRGHNYGSEGQLMEECNREILAISRKHGVPFEAPTMMGGGVMEWRRDRDRHLHVHSGFLVDRALPQQAGLAGGGGGGVRAGSAVDLLNLAAALARQSFPPTYKITILT